jgi:hypothetical protein
VDNAESKAATRERLWELHAAVLDALLAYFANPPEGGPTAAWISCARAFLRDNNVTIDGVSLADVRRSLGELRALSFPFIKDTQ